MAKLQRSTLQALAILISLVGGVYAFAVFLAFIVFDFGSGDISFNKEKWAVNHWAGAYSPTLRRRMLNDLFASEILDHKTKTEIINLLGNPDGRYIGGDFEITYDLDMDGFEQYISLRITFGKDGVVDSYDVVPTYAYPTHSMPLRTK